MDVYVQEKAEQQVARRQTRIAQIALRLDRVGEIEEAAGVSAERKIEELAERKLRFDKTERQAAIPKIEQSRFITEELIQTLTAARDVFTLDPLPGVTHARFIKLFGFYEGDRIVTFDWPAGTGTGKRIIRHTSPFRNRGFWEQWNEEAG